MAKAVVSAKTKLKNAPEIGTRMADGTIYVGISPRTNRPMYAAPADAPITMTFNAAVKYAKHLNIGGKKGFRVPSKEELYVLLQNREKGALKDTFNSTSSYDASWYWSSTAYPTIMPFMPPGRHIASCRTGCDDYSDTPDVDRSVRCVRCEGAKVKTI